MSAIDKRKRLGPLRLPHISRFEGRIMLAILVCATVPFLISLVFIPSIIESKLAMSMHARVDEQLEASALFYREFFDAKKKEYAARAETIARDPVLRRAISTGSETDVKARFDQVLAEQAELRRLLVRDPDGEILVERLGPDDRQGDGFRPRTIAFPLGTGDAPYLEATFILPEKYLDDRREAAEIALVYQAARKLESERARAFYLAYFGILVVAVGLSLGVGLWLSRGVTRRVARLAAATERMARGDMDFQVPVGGDDEIARLTRGFNNMISEVAEARDRIVYLEKVSGWQDLARRLAHEIKNPLTPIRLAVQELRIRGRAESPRLDELLNDVTEVVEEEVDALSRLVDEFSRFARLPGVTPARVDLRRFLEGFSRAYAMYREDLDLELVVPALGAEAPIDRVLMRRVLVNLVDNAGEAAGGKPVRVRVRGVYDPGSGRSQILVEDDGPGVSPDHAARIFEPYFTTKSTGTGLGLAIVKKIVLQHGGSITLRASPLGGASFVIGLPRVPEHLSTLDEDEDDSIPPVPPAAGQDGDPTAET